MFLSSPFFLFGLLAIAVPIVVHLFNLRRYKKIYFSNVRSLEQLQSETRRQSKLRQLLILAARILAIVFLTLAFAQPVIKKGSASPKTGNADVSIFIDNSFSMENTDGSGSLLEKSKSKAREIVAAFAPTDRFQLLTCDLDGRSFHWLSKEDMLSEIDNVDVSPASPMLSLVVGKQRDFLLSGSGTQKHAFYISDFQSSVTDLDAFPSDSLVSFTMIPLKSVAQNNVFIDSVATDAPVYYKGNVVGLTVWITNEGDEDLDKVPLTLFVDSHQRAIATAELPAHSTAQVEMRFTLETKGIVNCRVETSDYPVTFDDKYYFSLNVRDKVRLLVVEGNGDNPFLKRLFEGDSVVESRFMSDKQMDFSRLDALDIVILDEINAPQSGMAQSLYTFVSEGGTVVVIPSENADIPRYNDMLASFSAPRLAAWNTERIKAVSVDFDNSLYRNVFSVSNNSLREKVSELELPTVTGHYSLSSTGNSLRTPLISLAGGDEYVVHTPCGLGNMYLIASPLRDKHTDFVRQTLYVPTLYNMALFSIRPTQIAVSADAMTPVILGIRSDVADVENLRLVGIAGERNADFEEIPDIRRAGANISLIPHETIKEAGNYLLKRNNETLEGLSFNFSRRESTMIFVDAKLLEKQIDDLNLQKNVTVYSANRPLNVWLKEQMEGIPLWKWCVVFSLLMLLLEILLLRKII